MKEPLFELGRTVGTANALIFLAQNGVSYSDLLARHISGDWGAVPPEDARENELSVKEGFRIISSYPVGDGKVWIITEANRSATTVLLPEEY